MSSWQEWHRSVQEFVRPGATETGLRNHTETPPHSGIVFRGDLCIVCIILDLSRAPNVCMLFPVEKGMCMFSFLMVGLLGEDPASDFLSCNTLPDRHHPKPATFTVWLSVY